MLQIVIALIIGVLLAVFAISNLHTVAISVFGAIVQTPLIVLIVSLLAAGFILGKLVRVWPRSKPASKSERKPAQTAAKQPPPHQPAGPGQH